MMMYSMTPFGRNNSLSNFFDNFDRHFFSDMNTQVRLFPHRYS